MICLEHDVSVSRGNVCCGGCDGCGSSVPFRLMSEKVNSSVGAENFYHDGRDAYGHDPCEILNIGHKFGIQLSMNGLSESDYGGVDVSEI